VFFNRAKPTRLRIEPVLPLLAGAFLRPLVLLSFSFVLTPHMLDGPDFRRGNTPCLQ